MSVTGPGAFLGDPEKKTLDLYIEKINAAGGVLGRKLELYTYDDGTDASKANSFAKRLIEEDKVDILIGGTTTGSTMAMVPVVEKAADPVHLACRSGGDHRAGEEMGVQDAAYRPHGRGKGVSRT